MTTERTHPGAVLRRMLDDKGWTQDTLAAITGHSRQAINEVVAGKSRISPDMATRVGRGSWKRTSGLDALGFRAPVISCLNGHRGNESTRDALFRGPDPRNAEAALDSGNQHRGYMTDALAHFFRDGEAFEVALRRSDTARALSPPERAWLCRARQLAASSVFVAEFDSKRLPAAQKKLRQLAAYAKEIERLSEILAYYGIRFVVVEPLRGARIDGAAFWLGESPTIAVSARWDRIDACGLR